MVARSGADLVQRMRAVRIGGAVAGIAVVAVLLAVGCAGEDESSSHDGASGGARPDTVVDEAGQRPDTVLDQARPRPDTRVDEASAAPQLDTLVVVFTHDEAPFPVRRPVADTTRRLERALELLLAGPTEEERRRGAESWFSDATAGALRRVILRAPSFAVVDVRDLRPVIPGASSSTGSTLLLRELNGTVFANAAVDSVEYRMEGSCDLFWEWLQYGCRRVSRTD